MLMKADAPVLHLDNLLKHSRAFYETDAPGRFVICPLPGIHCEVTIEPSTFSEERIWDQVYINGKWCGNRHGGVSMLAAMISSTEPHLKNMDDYHGYEKCFRPPMTPNSESANADRPKDTGQRQLCGNAGSRGR